METNNTWRNAHIPIEYSLENDGAMEMARATGTLTVEDFMDMQKTMKPDTNLYQSPNCHPYPTQFVNSRKMKSDEEPLGRLLGLGFDDYNKPNRDSSPWGFGMTEPGISARARARNGTRNVRPLCLDISRTGQLNGRPTNYRAILFSLSDQNTKIFLRIPQAYLKFLTVMGPH